MKVFLQKGTDNQITNHNSYAAYDGFKQMGYEIRYFQDVNDLSDHQKEDVIVSYIGDVRAVLNQYDIVAPEIDYPEELTAFLGRKVWKSRLSRIANNPETWNVFIKPVEDKKFTGVVVRGAADLMGCGTYGEDPEILCSDVVHFIAEWRCFVRYGNVLDVRRYKGDWRAQFDSRVIENIVMQYKSAPHGYAVDIGVTDKGETLLIEVNDGYSLGHYGLFSLDYAKLLSARWSELTNTTDECAF